MRPQQQNRRMRGRNNNNNNRKGPNPLTRSYESNGPDVKIRGSAQQIAEKYATLARDAMSSGDRVMAENYLQHAEHYNRIIAAAQAQMPIQHQGGERRDDADDDMDDERDEFDGIVMPPQPYGNQNQYQQNQGRQGGNNNFGGGQYGQGGRNNGENGQYGGNGNRGQQPQPVNHAEAPQPVIEGMPAEIAFGAEGPVNRGENNRDGRGDRRDRRRDRERRFDNRDNREGDNGAASQQAQPPAAEQSELPSFVTAPVARREAAAVDDVVTAAEVSEAVPATEAIGVSAEGEPAPRRGRRPRRGSRGQGEGGQGEEGTQAAEAEPAPAEG